MDQPRKPNRNQSRKFADGSGRVYKASTGQWKLAITFQLIDGTSKRVIRNVTSKRHGLQMLDEMSAEYKRQTEDPQFVRVKELVDNFLSSLERAISTLDAYRNLLDNLAFVASGGTR